MNIFTRNLILIVCSILLSVIASGQQNSHGQTPVLVELKKSGRQLSYVVNSSPVADPLRALGVKLEQLGEDCPVVAIVPWNASLQEMSEIIGLASKAGFKNIRTFASDPSTGFMVEIKFGRSFPTSGNPPPSND